MLKNVVVEAVEAVVVVVVVVIIVVVIIIRGGGGVIVVAAVAVKVVDVVTEVVNDTAVVQAVPVKQDKEEENPKNKPRR